MEIKRVRKRVRHQETLPQAFRAQRCCEPGRRGLKARPFEPSYETNRNRSRSVVARTRVVPDLKGTGNAGRQATCKLYRLLQVRTNREPPATLLDKFPPTQTRIWIPSVRREKFAVEQSFVDYPETVGLYLDCHRARHFPDHGSGSQDRAV